MNASTEPNPAPPPARSAADSHGGVVRIVLIYAVFAALWILFSDPLANFFFRHSEQRLLVNIIKGWAFVAVTTLLLYALMRRRLGAAMPSAHLGSHRPLLTFIVLAAVIAALSTIAIRSNFRQHEAREVVRLKTISDLKTQQIGDWLKERHGTASILSTSPYLAENYQRWQAHRDSASRDRLQARMNQFLQDYGVSSISLLDEHGELKLSTSEGGHDIHRIVANAARQASSDRKIALITPYRNATGRMHLDLIAPMVAAKDPVPSLVLHIEPSRWLFPALQTWPIPSVSGETLLFRGDGDHVQFLNELRHRSDTAAKLRIPLSSEKVLAVQVLRGAAKTGEIINGVDYRHVPVVGMARTIPGTDWYLVVKLDRTEFYGAARQEAVWIALTGVLVLFIVAAGLHLSRQHQALDLAARTGQAQNERLRALRLLAAIADSSEDAILAKDMEGRYLLFNRAATEFTGRSAEEVLGKDDFFLFPPREAELLQDFGRRVIEQNRILTEEEILTTPHGMRTFLATKGPLHNSEGQVIGLYGITRDITERKKIEAQLRLWANAFEFANFGLAIAEAGGNTFLSVNPSFARERGYTQEELVGKPVLMIYPEDQRETIKTRIADLNASGHGVFESEHQGKDGHRFPVWMDVTVVKDADGHPVSHVAYALDITERKRASAALLVQTEEMQRRNEELERFNRATVGRELNMIELKKQVNALARELGRPPPYPLTFLNEPDGGREAP